MGVYFGELFKEGGDVLEELKKMGCRLFCLNEVFKEVKIECFMTDTKWYF